MIIISVQGIINDLLKDLFSKKAKSFIKDIRETTTEIMNDIDREFREALHHAVKSFISATIIILGLIFALTGISLYLQHIYPDLDNGLGFVTVGIAITIIGLLTMKVKVSLEE